MMVFEMKFIKRIHFFLIVYFSIPNLLIAQSNAGLLLNDAAYDTLPVIQKEKGVKYPIQNENNLKKYCPIPGDQGGIGACVGWATSYHALTINKAIRDSITDKEEIQALAYSASYIYNQIIEEEECGKGAYLTDGLRFLKNYGAPLSSTFRNSKFDCFAEPDAKTNVEALNNRIKNFYPIFKSIEKDAIKIEETRHWIARGRPVIIGMNLTENFGDITFMQKLWTPDLNKKTTAYHAMVVVGYEDAKQEFELLNSYGPYWGNDGFIKIKYENYAQLVKYAFVIDSIGTFSNTPFLDFDNNNSILGEGNFDLSMESTLQKVTDYTQDGSPILSDLAVYFNGKENYYEATQASWRQWDQYQINLKKLSSGNYLYAFSFNGEHEIVAIYPPTDPLEKIIAAQNRETSIKLELDAVGKDYVCMLYTNQPIVDFDNYLKKIATSKGYFKERLQNVFGNLLIPSVLVNYEKNALGFNYSFPNAKQMIIPVILAFDVK